MNEHKLLPLIAIVLLACGLWFVNPPKGLQDAGALADVAKQADLRIWEADRILSAEDAKSLDDFEPTTISLVRETSNTYEPQDPGRRAWRLFVLFAATIALILCDAMPIFVAAIGSLAIAILTGTLTTAEGYSGFSAGFIILIVVAFTIAIGFAKSGLGERLAYMIIGRFGKSTLGLAYSLIATDVLIAPAFPSNTARSGVLFPIVDSVARSSGSPPEPESRRKVGSFLVMASIIGLSLSSALWLTAMAANPAGAELASKLIGEEVDFLRWFKAASLPTLLGVVMLPYLLYCVFPPEVKQTPNAPEIAKQRLREMGAPSRDEKVMGCVFVVMIVFWAMKGVLGVDSTAVAIGGLFVLMLSRVVTLDDVKGSNGPTTFVWFASLYTLSKHLNDFGFMHWIGQCAATWVAPFSWPVVYVLLVVAYVLMHYFFVSQTAHMFAVYPIFLSVGLNAGVPGSLLAIMLLLATNFFSPLTPQASSANAIFVGSGYVTTGEVYKYGGLTVLAATVLYLLIGTPWIFWVR